ncbi:MAG: FAD-dependent oxidoreductase [Myxococcales bacterium]|nr:MAG: FAD-dependent oxidoreductase [Myxococcales bacterium]
MRILSKFTTRLRNPAIVLLLVSCASQKPQTSKYVLNDIHSKLNPTAHRHIYYPATVEQVQKIVRRAKRMRQAISISGGQHSMGGQQFGTNTLHLSTTHFNDVLQLNSDEGWVEVESGIQWPKLIDWLVQNQRGQAHTWGIRQKQTGADRLSIGGALSSNIHGRGLLMKPIVDDVESFTLVDAEGRILNCSRKENTELFRLAIGGYGLFGFIATVKLRLAPRQRLERRVELVQLNDFYAKVNQALQDGSSFGDLQFSIDPEDPDFLQRGVFSTYRPLLSDEKADDEHRELEAKHWRQLYYWAHTNKAKAYAYYTQFYLQSTGQRYWSDRHQLGIYLDDYHQDLDRKLGSKVSGSEMISEVYVQREKLANFMKTLANDFRRMHTNVIYGTIRLIKADDESFLAWAKKDYACIVINLHVDHDAKGIEKAKKEFRTLIERALEGGGSFFLTYHRWASKSQILRAYPQFVEFLRLKQKYDPEERFQSDWYRHYKHMFLDELKEAASL